MLPFEFVVIGKPISHQAKERKRVQAWKDQVRSVAESYWKGNVPLGETIQVVITHYYDIVGGDESAVPDSDNIVKPIRDALNGLIYVDDYQITDFISRRRNLNGSFRVKGISPALAEGFSKGQEFLHIRIEPAPDPGDLD
jgi:crossover junction endodeoxyribonuclease RusA